MAGGVTGCQSAEGRVTYHHESPSTHGERRYHNGLEEDWFGEGRTLITLMTVMK